MIPEPAIPTETTTGNSIHALSRRQHGLPMSKFPKDHCKFNFRILWNQFRFRMSYPIDQKKCNLLRFYLRWETRFHCKDDGEGGTWLAFNVVIWNTPKYALRILKEVWGWEGNLETVPSGETRSAGWQIQGCLGLKRRECEGVAAHGECEGELIDPVLNGEKLASNDRAILGTM